MGYPGKTPHLKFFEEVEKWKNARWRVTPDEIKKKVMERAEREAAESKEASRRDEEITP